MNNQKLIEEIKKLYNQNQIITGFFNGSIFTDDSGKIYDSNLIIKTSNDPGTAIIIPKDDKYLCILAKSNFKVRENILTNRRLKRKEDEEKGKPFKVLFRTEKIIDDEDYVVFYIGGYIKNPKEIYKIKKSHTFNNVNQFTSYLNNYGKDKFFVSLLVPVNNTHPDYSEYGNIILVQIDEAGYREYTVNNSPAYYPFLVFRFLGNGNLVGYGSPGGSNNEEEYSGMFCNYTITRTNSLNSVYPPPFNYSLNYLEVGQYVSGFDEYCVGTITKTEEIILNSIFVYLKNKNNLNSNLSLEDYSRNFNSYELFPVTNQTTSENGSLNYLTDYFINFDYIFNFNSSDNFIFNSEKIYLININTIIKDNNESLLINTISYNIYDNNTTTNETITAESINVTLNSDLKFKYLDNEITLNTDLFYAKKLALPNNFTIGSSVLTLDIDYAVFHSLSFNSFLSILRSNGKITLAEYESFNNSKAQEFLTKEVIIYVKNNNGNKYKIEGTIDSIIINYDNFYSEITNNYDQGRITGTITINVESESEENFLPQAVIGGAMYLKNNSIFQCISNYSIGTTPTLQDVKNYFFDFFSIDFFGSFSIYSLIILNNTPFTSFHNFSSISNAYNDYINNYLSNFLTQINTENIAYNLNFYKNNIYIADRSDNDTILNDLKTQDLKRCALHYVIENNGDISEQTLKVDDVYSIKDDNAEILHISYHPNV